MEQKQGEFNSEKKISTDVAVKEVISFLTKKSPKLSRRGHFSEEKVKVEYIDLIEYVEDGLISFDDNFHPTLTLRNPIFGDSENEKNIVRKISFKSRVKAADKTRVMNGIDIEKRKGDYILSLISFLCGLNKAEVNDLESDDYDVINQICSVF